MKKCLAAFLALMLLLGSALAEGFTQNNAAITIDGVRVAFFDAEGNYLQPMEKDGLLWVPLNALCENLGKTAQVQGQSIMVDGRRVGLFDENGNFLMPEDVNGTAYVPLKAFCEAAEISLTQSGDTYAVQRAAAAPVTPEPAPAATAVPFYGYVPLTEANFSDFFNVSTTYTESNSDYRTNSFTTTHHLTVQAATSYGLENVVISFAEYGRVAIPASGYAKAQYTDTIYKSSFGTDKAYIYGIMGKQTENILLYSYTANYTIKSVSGRLRMSYQEAESLLAGYYQKAGSSGYDRAIGYYELLVQADYKDSREKLKEVKAKKAAADKAEAERKAREKEEANLKKYNEAQVMLDEGRYGEAIEAFTALKDYKDSQSKLAEATEKKNAEDYNKAAALETQGKYDEAIEAFKALGDYKDSPQRLIACENAKQLAQNRAAYAWAEALEEAGEYIKAYDAFKALGDFEDSARRMENLYCAKMCQEAAALMSEKKFDEAWRLVEPLMDKSPEAEKIYWEANLRMRGMAHAMSPEGTGWVDGYGMIWGLIDQAGNVLADVDHGSIGPWKDGYSLYGKQGKEEWSYYDTQGRQAFRQTFKAAEDFHQGKAVVTKQDGKQAVLTAQGEEITLPEEKGRQYCHYVGEDLVSFQAGYQYGLMNLQGKVIVKAKYGDIKPFRFGLTLLKTNKGQALINAKGKEVIKAGKYSNIIILGEDMLAVQKKDNSKTLSIVNLKGKEYPKAKSNIDGGWIDAERQGDVILLKDKLRWWAFDLDMNPLEVYSEGKINVGYQNAVFHLDRGELNNLWNSKKDGKKALAMEGKNGDCKLSPDSPYILWKSEEAGWVIMDSEGNIIF